MAKRATPPITLPEYERLFRTIHAVVANEQGDPTKACLFFAVAGAFLLKPSAITNSIRPARLLAWRAITYGCRTTSQSSLENPRAMRLLPMPITSTAGLKSTAGWSI